MSDEQASDGIATRARILGAAAELARTGAARVTVRAVAARAGVGIGTLRYHFPTQRGLLDAVLSSIYEEAMPDERIRDAAVPPRDRLMQCLRHLLGPVGLDRQARETWTQVHQAFIDPEAPAEVRAGYLELERQAQRRLESWLSILTEEGAVAPGDTAFRARFILTVVTGLSVQRALPTEVSPFALEDRILGAAIDQVLVG